MIRAFIALELPKQIKDFVASLQNDIRSFGISAKWVNPENSHLTLKFLGYIHPNSTEAVITAASEAAKTYTEIKLSAKGVGVFPDMKRLKVIWTGLKGETFKLIEFQKELEAHLEIAGFPKEGKAFKAHLTLARVKDKIDPNLLMEAIQRIGSKESESFSAAEIILFKSDLKPSGPIYTKLKTIPIGL